MNLMTENNFLSLKDINYCDVEPKIINMIKKSDILEIEDCLTDCKLLINILKILENYLNLNLKQNDQYKTFFKFNELFNVNYNVKNIETLLCGYLFFKKNYTNLNFLISLEKENMTFERHVNLLHEHKNKLEKNGILYCNNLLYIENIDMVNIEKFKRKLNLSKYCEEKFQNNIANTFNSNNIFIYFRD